jgi:hypothetical protein
MNISKVALFTNIENQIATCNRLLLSLEEAPAPCASIRSNIITRLEYLQKVRAIIDDLSKDAETVNLSLSDLSKLID